MGYVIAMLRTCTGLREHRQGRNAGWHQDRTSLDIPHARISMPTLDSDDTRKGSNFWVSFAGIDGISTSDVEDR